MELSSLAIPVVITALISLLLYFIIGGKGHWSLKVLTIGFSTWIGFIVWNSIDSYKGFATEQSMPDKFLIHWVIVHEENKQTGNPGTIFLWVTPLVKPVSGILDYESNEPRTYKVPYDRKLHELMEDIIKRLKNGEIVVGTKKGKKGSKKGQGNGKGNGNGAGRGDGSGDGDESTGKNGQEGSKGFGSFSLSEDGYDLGPIAPAIHPEK